MHRAYTSLVGHDRRRGRRRRELRGFSLVELLAVMTIAAILMGVAVRSIRPPVSRAGMAASQLLRGLDLARATAMAGNRTVWVHLAPDPSAPENLVVRFHRSRDGSGAPAAMGEFRRPERFDNLAVSNEVPDFVERPHPNGAVRLEAGAWVVFQADGQAYPGATQDDFPAASATLAPVIEIGLQATNRGTVTKATGRDAAVVHLHGATGASQVFEP